MRVIKIEHRRFAVFKKYFFCVFIVFRRFMIVKVIFRKIGEHGRFKEETGKPLLNNTSKCMCSWGGVISVTATPAVTINVP